MDESVKEIVELTAKNVANDLLTALGSATISIVNLDNSIYLGQPNQEADPMCKRIRIHVTLPNGEETWLRGSSISEAFTNGLERCMRLAQKDSKTKTLEEFVNDVYLKSFVDGLAPTTLEQYTLSLNRYILPYLGSKRLDEITVMDIQNLYNTLANKDLSGLRSSLNKKSIERVSGLLGRIFHIAIDMGLIDESPIKKTLLRNNGKQASHHKAIEREDMDKIKRGIPSLDNERERLYMGLLAYAGMRPEEILGMKWECVHLDEGYCDMIRTVTFPDKSAPCVRDCGKTESSIRSVVLPQAAIAVLKEAPCKEGYVVHGDTKDKPVSYSTYQRTYRGAFKNLGVNGKCCSYDFRTTYGTELCEAGLTTKQVADMMGHANTRMVETVYAKARHSGVMKNKNLLDRMNEMYN